jgi:beta-glucanase (GH16 family)
MAALKLWQSCLRGKGTWPAIWMLSTDWKYGGWPASGEIDIMDTLDLIRVLCMVRFTPRQYNHSKGTQKEGKISVTDAQDKLHLYAIEWSADKIDFYVDDKKYHTVTKSPNEDFKGWPFDQRFHLIRMLPLAATGVEPKEWTSRSGHNVWR